MVMKRYLLLALLLSTTIGLAAWAETQPQPAAPTESPLQSETLPPAEPNAPDLSADTPSDAAITGQVLNVLKETNAIDVAVTVKDGVVFLAGIVGSEAERVQLVDQIGHIEGVKDINADALLTG
jgi:hypothetical protein